ncbi:ATP-dependent protease subunit HslV [Thermodesulfatator atlanticus]|uniref:ATP-dependent protease subunit HslV n=1 Tax=Thermodesulfatator atlanticus TaxID=501497 RepID=UPI0003B59900|nr:ATP-dependent protease subunit HslV [Thermodesulfatator atlanticus]
MKGTTIIAIKKDGKVVVAGDGQVSLGDTVIKQKARKVRRLYHGKVVVGFAGATADALTLFERLEKKLEEYGGQLVRAVVELAKDWRTERTLRRLEAMLIACDKNHMFLLSGAGDVMEPDDQVLAIGSGGTMALAAAKALLKHTSLSAREIALEAMQIAASICVYTNDQIVVEEL